MFSTKTLYVPNVSKMLGQTAGVSSPQQKKKKGLY
jgi:hypothetical protein